MTAQDRTTAIMTAVRAAMINDPDLASLVGQRVYDMAPEGALSPYIVIGDAGYRDSSTDTSEAQDFNMDLHVFDTPQDRGSMKDTEFVRAIMKALRALLHRADLTVPDVNTLVCDVVGAPPVTATVDEIHGVLMLRVLAGHE